MKKDEERWAVVIEFVHEMSFSSQVALPQSKDATACNLKNASIFLELDVHHATPSRTLSFN